MRWTDGIWDLGVYFPGDNENYCSVQAVARPEGSPGLCLQWFISGSRLRGSLPPNSYCALGLGPAAVPLTTYSLSLTWPQIGTVPTMVLNIDPLPFYCVRVHAHEAGRATRYLNSSQSMTPSVSPRSFQRVAAAAAKAAQHESGAVTTGTISAPAPAATAAWLPVPLHRPPLLHAQLTYYHIQLRAVNDC